MHPAQYYTTLFNKMLGFAENCFAKKKEVFFPAVRERASPFTGRANRTTAGMRCRLSNIRPGS